LQYIVQRAHRFLYVISFVERYALGANPHSRISPTLTATIRCDDRGLKE
jgi:hypothetical protein